MWSSDLKTIPRDGQPISLGSGALRNLKAAMKSVIEVDHEDMASEYAGRHKVVRLAGLESDPVSMSDKAMLYARQVNETPELYLLDKDGVRKTMISHRGLVANARFSAYLSANKSVPAYSTEPVPFDTVDYDLYSEFDALAFAWFPAVSGLYYAGVRVVTNTALQWSTTFYLKLRRDATDYIINSNGYQGGGVFRAQAGDRVWVDCVFDSSLTTGVITGGSAATRFSATLLLS